MGALLSHRICRACTRCSLTLFLIATVFAGMTIPGRASEADAVAISRIIRQRHLPYGTILDPLFKTTTSDEIDYYARAGDSAIWTGHYLAAESFRFKLKQEPEALDNIRTALAGIRLLVDATGSNVLARCVFPADSPYATQIINEENRHGVYRSTVGGREYLWLGNTSRDQYSGIFFGLAIAFDLVDDAQVRADVTALVTRLLDFLIDRNWFVVMPNGSITTTFAARADQRLTFLQIGKRINPGRFESRYNDHRFFNAGGVNIPIGLDVLEDHENYFKFNLDAINLYNLIRLESSSFYRNIYLDAYGVLRRTTDDHGNAHFNVIDTALRGKDSSRDAQTRDLLNQWLLITPRRDIYLDWRPSGRYPACGQDSACDPLPIIDRIRTDFLWQRSPFLLYGGGTGKIETAGIDYILPYWMGRYYGVVFDSLTVPGRPNRPTLTRRPASR